jgi:hypothetical protein
MSKLRKEFERVAEISAQLVVDLQEVAKDLRKNEAIRIFLGVMEYPVPPSKKLASEKELEVYQMAVGLKEMQMKMGVINLALKEEEVQSGNEDKSVQD